MVNKLSSTGLNRKVVLDNKRSGSACPIALFGNVAAFEAVHHFKKISVKDVIKGFGMHMMNMQVSNTNRMQSANIMGSFIDCIIDTTKNSWQYKQMYRVNHLHLENVRYLLNRLNEE